MPELSVAPTEGPARLLLIDASGALAQKLAEPLAAASALPPITIGLTSGRHALELLKTSEVDLVAADLGSLEDLGDTHEERITRIARAAMGALVLVLGDDASISATLGAMRAGAHDCVARDIEPNALVARMGALACRHGKALGLARPIEEPAAREPQAPSIPMMRDLILPMWRQEQRIIENAIQSFAGNISLAAAALELSPSTIYRKRQAWAEMNDKRRSA
jgi:DNA-binding NtrC family response regulator